jgi:hypothetical protein
MQPRGQANRPNPKQSIFSPILIPLNKQQNKQKFESPVFKQDDMNLQLKNELTRLKDQYERQKAAQNIPPSQGYSDNNFYRQPYPQQPQHPNQFINRPQ